MTPSPVKSSDWPINIPNILTLLRILLTPLFVILLLKQLFGYAFLVFALAGISDALDGFIARVFNQRTVMGAYLDPIADKLLLAAAFISLAILEIVPSWLTVIVITRDILISIGMAVFSITNIKVSIKPSLVSKCTTAAQLGTICLTLINIHFSGLSQLELAAFWTTAGLTTLSGLHYLYVGVNILQAGLGPAQDNE
jgi:cardiolipin synthase (CMP-forming)